MIQNHSDSNNPMQAGAAKGGLSSHSGNQWQHRVNSTVYSPNGAILFSESSFHDQAIFLSDGITTVRYQDLPTVIQNAHHQFQNLCNSRKLEKPPSACVAGIDTTNRFESILWMVYCWVHAIPFVPFCADNPEPVTQFLPEVLLVTSDETLIHPHIKKAANGAQAISDLTIPGKSLAEKTLQNYGTGVSLPLPGAHLPFTDQPRALFCGLLTSGSSGRPKRVALLRKNMIAATRNSFRDIRPDSDAGEHLWGNCLPLHHTGGLSIIFRALLSGTGVFLWNRFDAGSILDALHGNPSIKRISLVPTMLKRLVDCSQKSGITSPAKLQQILTGGGPSSPELIRHVRNMGWPVCFSYGMTETCGQIASQNTDGSSPFASVGLPFPDHDIVIRDDTGKAASTGMVGALHVRGPQLFPGYLPDSARLSDFDLKKMDFSSDDPDLTTHSSNPASGGWFRTGDYARLDKQGNLYIEARRTDLIVSGGENVNPVEVESILLKCADIADAGISGLPDEEWGQLVVAFIVPKIRNSKGTKDTFQTREEDPAGVQAQYSETQQRIFHFISNNLKPHQRPKKIGFTDSLPRTSLGKLERKKLQDQIKVRFFQK